MIVIAFAARGDALECDLQDHHILLPSELLTDCALTMLKCNNKSTRTMNGLLPTFGGERRVKNEPTYRETNDDRVHIANSPVSNEMNSLRRRFEAQRNQRPFGKRKIGDDVMKVDRAVHQGPSISRRLSPPFTRVKNPSSQPGGNDDVEDDDLPRRFAALSASLADKDSAAELTSKKSDPHSYSDRLVAQSLAKLSPNVVYVS